MKLTGFRIMDRLEQLKERSTALDAKFTASLYKFDDEVKQTPIELLTNCAVLENKIADLQEAQSKLNLKIKVMVNSQEMTLEKAIKCLGIFGRLKNQWKIAAGQQVKKPGRYSRYDLDEPMRRERDSNIEVAKPQMTETESLALVDLYTKMVTDLKQSIRIANAKE